MINNPFILYGYESEKYFCDRKEETAELKRLVTNGNNVALIAPRRIGKTGLIENLFHQKDICRQYYTFLIDIYATKSLEEMVLSMGASMMVSLRPRGVKVMQRFVSFLRVVQPYMQDRPRGGVELFDQYHGYYPYYYFFGNLKATRKRDTTATSSSAGVN